MKEENTMGKGVPEGVWRTCESFRGGKHKRKRLVRDKALESARSTGKNHGRT